MRRDEKEPLQAKLELDHPFFGIISRAYRVFSCPKPSKTDVCENCCMDPDIEADFFKPSIQQLPLRYIQDWYCAAYDPHGVSKQTWSYLLPRILEILAFGEHVSVIGIQVSLNRFRTGYQSNWDVEQWRVLDEFQRAFLGRCVNSSTDFLDDAVCMFALAGWPLPELFEQLDSMPTPVLVERFWKDWCKGRLSGREGVWITAFWDEPKKALEYYTSRALHDRVEELALADGTDPSLARKAHSVASVIEASWLSNKKL